MCLRCGVGRHVNRVEKSKAAKIWGSAENKRPLRLKNRRPKGVEGMGSIANTEDSKKVT